MKTKRLAEIRQKHAAFIAKERRFAASKVREETPREKQRRLRLGWDWRNGGRAARDKARGIAA